MNKQLKIFDLDATSDLSNDVRAIGHWVRTNSNLKDTHHIIIKRILEGEVHFLQPDPFLNGLQEALQDWPNDCATLIMGDVNLKENITKWYGGHETRVVPFECLSMPLALLKRTQEYDVNKAIPKPKEYEQKYKKFICLNAAAKPHRAKLVCHLIDNEGHEGYISWLNRYGKLPEKYFKGSKFKGEEMLLDFNGSNIDKDNNQDILPINYHYAGFEIVQESIVSDTSLFVTEKTWKPLFYNKIFIPHGPRGLIKWLESLGFESFTELYDTSFDLLPYKERYEELKTQIEKLLKFGAIDWVDIYKDPDIRKKLEHNAQLARTMHVDGWEKYFK